MKPNRIVSIIVPVYNEGNHVHACVQSVLKQTSDHFELLLINDGSSDESGQICDAYAAEDARIQVMHTANQGVASARNEGLKQAKGAWLLFLDADDTLQPDVVRSILDNDRLDPMLEMMIGSYRHVYPLHCVHMQNEEMLADGLTIAHKLGNGDVKACIGSFAVKRELVVRHRIAFYDGSRYGEDVEFMYYCLFHAAKVRVFQNEYVHYMINKHSAIAKASFARFDSFLARRRTLVYLKQTFPYERQLTALFEHVLLPQSLIDTVLLLCRSKVSVYKIMDYLQEHDYIDVMKQAKTSEQTPSSLRGELKAFLDGPLLTWSKCLWEGYYYHLRRALGIVKRAVIR